MKINTYQSEVDVYRRSSKNLPNIEATNIDWEETVYLNLIMQHVRLLFYLDNAYYSV